VISTGYGCEQGAGDLKNCNGANRYLGLCDICAVPYRLLNGGDEYERLSPGKINMLQRQLLMATNIDPEVEWRAYVE
jgi:hypothetical protein